MTDGPLYFRLRKGPGISYLQRTPSGIWLPCYFHCAELTVMKTLNLSRLQLLMMGHLEKWKGLAGLSERTRRRFCMDHQVGKEMEIETLLLQRQSFAFLADQPNIESSSGILSDS